MGSTSERRVRVLLIEDHPVNRKLVGDVLRHAGHEVIEAASADEGIPLALECPPDLVLMDVQLPGTDGLTATRLLKSAAETRDVPVVAVTAHAMAGDEQRIREAGCDDYLAKPISYRALLEVVGRFAPPPDE